MRGINIKSCFGISSKCFDGNHILFCDFDCNHDNHNFNTIKRELKDIQKDYDLSQIYILNSNNGYNAFCLTKLSLQRVKTILDSMAMIDGDYVEYGFRRGYYTLRIGQDKRFIERIDRFLNLKYRNKSNAHRIFFKNMLGININKSFWFDTSDVFIIIQYPSDKDGYYAGDKR